MLSTAFGCSLVGLDMHHNHLSGTMAPSVFAGLSKLETLYLAHNSLTGT